MVGTEFSFQKTSQTLARVLARIKPTPWEKVIKSPSSNQTNFYINKHFYQQKKNDIIFIGSQSIQILSSRKCNWSILFGFTGTGCCYFTGIIFFGK